MKSSWTIGQKLITAFLGVSLVTLALGLCGYFAVRADRQAVDEIGIVQLPAVDYLSQIGQAATAIKVAQRTLLVPNLDAETRQRQYENVKRVREEYEVVWKKYEELPKDTATAALWAKLGTAWQEWRAENTRYFELCQSLDKTGIHNPARLCWDLARFRGDHYKLRDTVQAMLQSHQVFDGGEDHKLCGFGKWLAEYTTDSADVQKSLEAATVPHERVHAACAHIKQLVRDQKYDEAVTVYLAEMAPAADEFLKHFEDVTKQAGAAQQIASQAYAQSVGKCREAEKVVTELVDQTLAAGRDAAMRTVRDTQRRSALATIIILVAVIVGVGTAVALGLLITRGIKKALQRVAGQLDDGANQVSDAAGQVSSAAQQLAEGASEQASSLEETSSALEEMAAMTRTNAENSKQANDLAGQARQAAAEGDQSMVKLNEAMTAIRESSSKISRIIKVIEEIAFQTNLLALNAAVEAARAGEHGKGFAGVAEEVRNLAQRCATAARDTTGLIEDAVQRAQQGTQVSTEVGKSLGAIVNQASKVSELINGIARASAEQAQGVEQVNVAVSQMDKLTQQSAAGAEESASAAEELSAQAQTVKGMVAELVAVVGSACRRTSDRVATDPPAAPGTACAARAATPASSNPAPTGGTALHGKTRTAGTAAEVGPGDHLADF
jgi:methyl-accepting chemotaxis protein